MLFFWQRKYQYYVTNNMTCFICFYLLESKPFTQSFFFLMAELEHLKTNKERKKESHLVVARKSAFVDHGEIKIKRGT